MLPTQMTTNCGHPLEWAGCYQGNYDWLVDEAVAHPAKMAPGLLWRILEHLEELGLISKDSVILDFMAGTGITAIGACLKGYQAITLELEERFVAFQVQNKAALEKKLGHPVDWTILQGDARHLSEILKEKGLIGITSPPYQTGTGQSKSLTPLETGTGTVRGHGFTSQGLTYADDMGETPGQIGNLPDKPIAVTSPPWNLQSGGRGEASRKSTPDNGLIDRHGGGIKGGSGDSPGNIGTLPDRPLTAITSPPYYSTEAGGDKLRGLGKGAAITEYGQRPNRGMGGDRRKETTKALNDETNIGLIPTVGNKGRDMPEYYLGAMSQVYAEIAKVADVLVCVVKNPTRNGKLRRLDLDTIALLEATGWKLHCQHRAILFEEQEMGHLFEGQVKKPRGRMSFFKRLSYRKGASVAQWEDVLVATKGQGQGMCAVTSPPYGIEAPNLNASELDGPIGNRSRQKENRPPGDPLVAITSPPYQDTLQDQKPLSERQDKTAQILRAGRPKTYDKTGAGSAGKGYGSTPGQIGKLRDK